MTRLDDGLALRALILAFARREWRDRRNVYLTVGVLVLAAMLGDSEGLRAGALPAAPVFNVLRLKYAAVWLSVVLGILLAARLQADRRDGWLISAIVSGAVRPRHYLLSVSLVSLCLGALQLTLGGVAYVVAWANSAHASPLAGVITLPAILVFWISCLAFFIAVATWQRHTLWLVGAPVVLMVVPFYLMANWILRHERDVSPAVSRIVLIFAPPRTISLEPTTLLYYAAYISVMSLIAVKGSAKTLRRLD